MVSFQVDESADVSSCAQFVFVRYIQSGHIKEEFLFCCELDATTTSADVMKMMTIFLKHFDCNGKKFVVFVPMELSQCLVPGQALQKK